MIPVLDETHDPSRQSWVVSANGHVDFPIQNLPLGVFSPPGKGPRAGVAIGDLILDLAGLTRTGLLPQDPAAEALQETTLNAFLALGAPPRKALRRRLSALLSDAGNRSVVEPLLHDAAECAMHLPARIGDYTDFYAGIHHAVNVGRLFRPDNPLLPNYKYVPIGYHGRASSIRVSGAEVRRPEGQTRAADADAPGFGPTRRLDYELELGIWIGAGNQLGEPIPISEAEDHIAGLCLLNDWSARDIQAWEYQPLGPFLAKNFMTTISPWIVTAEALAPFRIAQPQRPVGDPAPLAYLRDDRDQAHGAYAIGLEAFIETERMRADGLPPHRLSRSSADAMYWTAAQLVTHHASGGCNLQPGDLLGTGTLSMPEPGGFGSLLEITAGGRNPITLPSGETRTFLDDGDQLILAAQAARDGFIPIGFAPCAGTVRSPRDAAGWSVSA